MPRLPGLENDINPQLGLTPKNIEEIGNRIWHYYLGEGSLLWPIGTDIQTMAAYALEEIGFEKVEWAQAGDDLLLLCLWYRVQIIGAPLSQIIIQFADHNADSISYFTELST